MDRYYKETLPVNCHHQHKVYCFYEQILQRNITRQLSSPAQSLLFLGRILPKNFTHQLQKSPAHSLMCLWANTTKEHYSPTVSSRTPFIVSKVKYYNVTLLVHCHLQETVYFFYGPVPQRNITRPMLSLARQLLFL